MNGSSTEPAQECKVCGAPSRFFGSAKVLGKHDVRYFECSTCGFMQTESPFWLAEAYGKAITASDLGYVFRNQWAQRVTRALLSGFFDPDGRFLDYGGGYGLFTRMMRDAGFNFYRSDLYCENLFAAGFDALPEARGFELLTAFEVFEHLVAPVEELATMLSLSPSIFFSTQLLPTPAPPLAEWWYYGLEHGQHVALHTHRSLEILAESHQLNFLSDYYSLHLFTPKRISERFFRLAIRRAAPWINFLRRRRSLLPGDFRALTGKTAG